MSTPSLPETMAAANDALPVLERLDGEERASRVAAALAALPGPESVADVEQRVRLIALRARHKLLLGPDARKEAEAELRRAVRTRSEVSVWNALAEALYNRGAVREAYEAAESAVKCSATDVAALCTLSRLARVYSTVAPDAKRADLVAASILRARQAIAAAPTRAAGWAALSLAHLREARIAGFNVAAARKALAAAVQATKIDPTDPDAWNNRGAMEHMLLCFSAAGRSFHEAWTLDPTGLPTAGTMARCSHSMLHYFARPVKPDASLGDQRKRAAALKAAKGEEDRVESEAGLSAGATAVTVETLMPAALSDAALAAPNGVVAAPLPAGTAAAKLALIVWHVLGAEMGMVVVAATERATGAMCCVSISNLNPAALAPGRVLTVFVPPAEAALTAQFPPPAARESTAAAFEPFALRSIWVDARHLRIDGSPAAVVATEVAFSAVRAEDGAA
jgi:tetratricopeptide (TPR) repeat protein